MKINEQGRSMIEMLGVLAIIGVLSVGGFNMVNKMQTSYSNNQVLDAAGELATRTRVLMRDYDGEKNTSMNKFLCKGKAVPDALMENVDCDNVSEFTGNSDVKYNVFYLGQKVTFVVQVQNVTEEMCMAFVTTNWGGPGSSGFLGVSVGDKYDDVNKYDVNKGQASDTIAIVGDANKPAPMGIGTAAKACSGDGLTINLSYR